jgi:short-chain fatty acids transporter
MIHAIARVFSNLVSRLLPDPLIFAILLTALTFALAIGLTPHSPRAILDFWGDGFWNLLRFSMQMALVLVTGHALANSRGVRRCLAALARLATTPERGVMLVTFFSAAASALNWGFGLVVGAFFAREVARRQPRADYRLLVASAYIGFLTWHGGLSGSIPLVAATPGNPLEKTAGLIPISETLLTRFNLFATLALILTLPILTRLMHPQGKDTVAFVPDPEDGPIALRAGGRGSSIAEKLEESRILTYLVAAGMVFYLVSRIAAGRFAIDIDAVNWIFLGAGLLLHGSPIAYNRAIGAAARSTAGILIQFPFYSGIQAVIERSGLGGLITDAFVRVATPHTFPLLAFLSSGLVNLAVPSGGGHWVVQGPFVIPAAKALGVPLGKAAMAIAYGEAWMNMAQPFWALPALAIAGLGIRDIMGYCVTALLYSGLIFGAALVFF